MIGSLIVPPFYFTSGLGLVKTILDGQIAAGYVIWSPS
jgi:hypothetical protein